MTTLNRQQKTAIVESLKLFRSCPIPDVVSLPLDLPVGEYQMINIVNQLSMLVYECGVALSQLAVGEEQHKDLATFSSKCAKVLNAIANGNQLKRV